MLQRPRVPRTHILLLVPLALLAGVPAGLLGGALSAQVPALRVLGPGTGAALTVLTASLGAGLTLWWLVRTRVALLARTSFALETDGLVVRWPGHEDGVRWEDVLAAERVGTLVRVRRRVGAPLILFDLPEPEHVLALIRARRVERPQPTSDRAA